MQPVLPSLLVNFHLSLIIQPQSSIAQQAQLLQEELAAPSSVTSQYLMVFISLCYVYLLMGLSSWIYYELLENIDRANFTLISQVTTMCSACKWYCINNCCMNKWNYLVFHCSFNKYLSSVSLYALFQLLEIQHTASNKKHTVFHHRDYIILGGDRK